MKPKNVSESLKQVQRKRLNIYTSAIITNCVLCGYALMYHITYPHFVLRFHTILRRASIRAIVACTPRVGLKAGSILNKDCPQKVSFPEKFHFVMPGRLKKFLWGELSECLPSTLP